MTLNVVAIDGPVGSGKSTVARALAAALGWAFLDTGAMYRAVTVAARNHHVALEDHDGLGALAERVAIETLPEVTVDGVSVDAQLRTAQTNEDVSLVASVPRVRAALVEQQRRFAHHHPEGVVVEGRDITTVVFPDARLKVYLTASFDERSRRRGDEGAASVQRRDAIDAGRAVSPLRRAVDATIVDTTGRNVDDVVKEILACLTTTN